MPHPFNIQKPAALIQFNLNKLFEVLILLKGWTSKRLPHAACTLRLSRNAACAGVIRDHASRLPAVNKPPASGSAHRILARENGVSLGEGKPINPAEKED
jgi:hypothetical protein